MAYAMNKFSGSLGIKQNLWFWPYSFKCVSGIHLGVGQKNPSAIRTCTCTPNFRVNVMFRVAGFRPGRRGPFVSAKGPKTIDAPSGLIKTKGRELKEGGPTRRAQTRPAIG